MRNVLHRYRTVTLLLVLLSGVWASPVSADVYVKGMLSTGETFDGKLTGDDGRRLAVKGKKQTLTFLAANVTECAVRVADERIPADIAGLRHSGLARFLLANGHDFLAEVTFLCALTGTAQPGTAGELTLPLSAMEQTSWKKLLDDKHMSAIKAAYAEARRKLPVRLGGRKTARWRPRRYQLPPPEAYGAAQSLARFLVFKGKSKFIQLVYRIKGGADSEKALTDVYGLSHKKLLQEWIRSVH